MRQRVFYCRLLAVAAAILGHPLWMPARAVAAEASGQWRSTYDTVMMWVNFFILVALLVKFLRKPLKKFLRDYRDGLARELERLEADKEKAEAAVRSFRETLDERKQKMELLHQRIVAQGEQERQELIEDARRQSALMLNNARSRAENRLREAGETLKGEMIDAAVAQAIAELPDHLAPEDKARWVDRFIDDIAKTDRPLP